MEVHDAEQKAATKAPIVAVESPPEAVPDEQVRRYSPFMDSPDFSQAPTIKKSEKLALTLAPPPSSQGRAGGLSVGRGDLDQAIRSMRTGKRRARPQKPASKIFVDGTRSSRIFE